MKTFDKAKMLHLLPVIPVVVQQLRNYKTANEYITTASMCCIKSEVDVLSFCDIIDQLVDSRDSKQFIAALRDGKYYIIHCIKYLYFC